MNKPLSNCCLAPLRLGCGDEGTNWYECTECGKPCDVYKDKKGVTDGGE